LTTIKKSYRLVVYRHPYHRRVFMKRFILFGFVMIFAVTFLASTLYAQDVYKTWRPANAEPKGEKVLWDSLVMRPAGLVTCVLGIGGFIVALPFALTSQTQNQAFDSMLVEPFNYTFARPVGLLDPANP
jgi:hypothetical protein